jgi:NlpC/P60 family putative phage cell wall peptidase
MTPTDSAADPVLVQALATAWLGTPYVHQQSVQGAGCDCLGLVRGVWRGLHGQEPEVPPPYTRGWGDDSGRELMLCAARRWMIELPLAAAGPGAMVLFRMLRGGVAKHCGILMPDGVFVHADQSAGVVQHPYTAAWSRRAIAAFQFPAAI